MRVTLALLCLILTACGQESSNNTASTNSLINSSGFETNTVNLTGDFSHYRYSYSGTYELNYAVAKIYKKGESFKGNTLDSNTMAIELNSEPIDCNKDISQSTDQDENYENYSLGFMIKNIDDNLLSAEDPGFAFSYTFEDEGWVNNGSYSSVYACSGPCIVLNEYSYGDENINAAINIDFDSGDPTGIALKLVGDIDFKLCQ